MDQAFLASCLIGLREGLEATLVVSILGMSTSTPAPTVLESVAWAVYVVPVLTAFLWPARPRAAATPSSPGAVPGRPSNPETHEETHENVRA